MKINIIPLILYWGFIIILVYTTGISVEPLAIGTKPSVEPVFYLSQSYSEISNFIF